MKRHIVLFLAMALMLLMFTGCQSEMPQESGSSTESETTTETQTEADETTLQVPETWVFTWEGLTLRADGYSVSADEDNGAYTVLGRLQVHFTVESNANDVRAAQLTNLIDEQKPFTFVDESGGVYECFMTLTKEKDDFGSLESIAIGSIDIVNANIEDYESVTFVGPNMVFPLSLLQEIS